MTRRFASIPVASVRIPDDILRSLDETWARALGAMMRRDGQAEPIEVAVEGKKHVLVFGLHRLVGAQREGLETIDALVDEEKGEPAARRRRAINENLVRRELSWLDRAIHIAELHALERERRGERRGGDRRSAAAKNQKSDDRTFDLPEEIAERIGLSRSSLFESLRVAERIGNLIRRRLVGEKLAWIADSRSDLMLLASGPGGDFHPNVAGAGLQRWQSGILDKIEAGKADDVASAISGKRAEPEAQRHTRLAVNAFQRLEPKNQQRFLDDIEPTIRDWAQKRGWQI